MSKAKSKSRAAGNAKKREFGTAPGLELGGETRDDWRMFNARSKNE